MGRQIRITFPEGGDWYASGLGAYVSGSTADAAMASGDMEARALLAVVLPVVRAETGEEPSMIRVGDDKPWHLLGWDGATLVYVEGEL